jgi:dimeric dUTPase (all-alpha-NTP-PPase superfamily)
MLDQLEELLEMQRVLDDAIFKEHGIAEYPVENMKLALFDELGELLHEFPTKYKHWKKTATDNREKGLEEYVDVLHFALSLHNYYDNYYGVVNEKEELEYDKCHDSSPLSWRLGKIYQESCNGGFLLEYLFDLGNYFGFSWEEIYTTYKKKNAVNYERLRNNY